MTTAMIKLICFSRITIMEGGNIDDEHFQRRDSGVEWRGG